MTPRATRGLALAGAGLCGALGSLDTSVNAALPAIGAAFAVEVRDLRWLVVFYVLVYVGLMLVAGRIGDLVGWRRVCVAGLSIGIAGYVACALAPSWPLFLAARVVQGVGAALMLSCAPALAAAAYEESRRAQALAAFAAMTALGGTLGPLVGGALVDAFGWPAIYWYRVPLALMAIVFLRFSAAEPPRAPGRTFDVGGAALIAAWLSALLLALSLFRTHPGTAIGLGVFGATLVWLWTVQAARNAQPILRPALFVAPGFALLNLANLVVWFASFAALLILPHWLVHGAGLSAGLGGVALAFGPAGALAGASLAGRLAGRIAPRALTLCGVAIAAAAGAALGYGVNAGALALVVIAVAAQGFGAGLHQAAYSDAVVGALPLSERGVAGSLTLLTRSAGVVAGAGLLSALYDWRLASHGFADAVSATFLWPAAALAAVLLAMAVSRAGPRGDAAPS